MSLAPARTVSPRSSIEPAAACALARNFSNALRAWPKLASAMDRISFGISKRSRTSPFMVPLLFGFGFFAFLLKHYRRRGLFPHGLTAPLATYQRKGRKVGSARLGLYAALERAVAFPPWTCPPPQAILTVC